VSEPVAGFDLKRAQRLVGVFAPVTLVALSPVALLVVAYAQWAQWLVLAVMVALVAGAGWVLARGENALVRVGAMAACLLFSGVALLLAYGAWTYGMGDGTGGLLTATGLYAMLGAPWIALIVGGTVAARAGRYPGNARVTIWWILALGASGLVYPVAVTMASNGIGDDMSPIVAFMVPPIAACLWVGPALLISGLTLARRGKAGPPADAEVTAT
jgi:uncharacterized membrane protein